MCSTFFILSMTFERFYSIIRPHKAASFNTVKRAKITIISVVIFSITYNFPAWFVTGQSGQSRNCVPYAHAMSSLHGQIYYWSSNVLSYFLPFVLLLVMNTVIINTLSKRSKSSKITRSRGQGQGEAEVHAQKAKNSETQIFVILLLVTFAFLILSSPTYIFIFLIYAKLNKPTPYGVATFHLLFSIAQKTYYTNYGINFYLYVMSGQKFRTDLGLLLKTILDFIMCKNSATHTSTSHSSLNTISSNVPSLWSTMNQRKRSLNILFKLWTFLLPANEVEGNVFNTVCLSIILFRGAVLYWTRQRIQFTAQTVQ